LIDLVLLLLKLFCDEGEIFLGGLERVDFGKECSVFSDF
jgi:hypothetical protein